MKKIISGIIAGFMLFSSVVPTYASSKDNITVNVNGKKMDIVGHPATLDTKTGRVLIPFKSLFLALGVPAGEIKWDSATSTASGTKDGITVHLTKNNINAKVNGIDVKMDNAPIIMGSSMMVPLSFVAKHMGGQTQWIGNPSYVVNITLGDGLFGDDSLFPTAPEVPTNPTVPVNPSGSAPAKDTGAKNNEIWGTYAVMDENKNLIVAQFRSDLKVDIKNQTTNQTETGSYTISGKVVTIKSNAIGGTYNLTSTTYKDRTYYLLKSSNNKDILALTPISYEQFASVY